VTLFLLFFNVGWLTKRHFMFYIIDPCEESSLFNLDGICVESSIEAKYAEEKPSFAFRIEAGAAVAEPAPVCKNAGNKFLANCFKPTFIKIQYLM
jgi:hypothetical protein